MLKNKELEFYSKQIDIESFGQASQEKLKESKVLIVGLGSIGGISSLALLSCGVGTIGLLDNDVVQEKNMQSQVIYSMNDVGKNKTDAAFETLTRKNLFVNIIKIKERLDSSNIKQIAKNYDYISDCSDNYETHVAISKYCKENEKIHVYASISEYDVQVAIFNQEFTFLDLYKNQEDWLDSKPKFLGTLPQIAGSIQANEIVKMIAGIGKPTDCRMLVYNTLDNDFEFV